MMQVQNITNNISNAKNNNKIQNMQNEGNSSAFAIQRDNGYSSMENGIALVPGKSVTLPDGSTLKWTTNAVQFSIPGGTDFNKRAFALRFAGSIANTMNQFTRIANKEACGVGRPVGITREKTNEIRQV